MNKTRIKILIFIALFFIGILVINNESQAASIPVVNIQGDLSRLTKDKNEENFTLTYTSTNLNFTKYVKMKLQGSSSLQYDKNNFTIKFYTGSDYAKKEKIDMGKGWGKFNKYCLKANVIDKTHARNIVTARIASQAQAKYNIFDDSPNHGLIDGFPVQVNINGSFYGLYTWNIAKDDFLWNLDKDDNNNIAVQAEMCNDYTYFKKQIESTTTIDDSKWEVEVGKDEEKENIKAKLNRLIKFVNESSDADFKANFNKYINKDAMLNYLAIMYATEGYDNVAKNLVLVTKDGNIWYPTLYDLDTTWGIRHSGILGKQPGKCDDYYWVPDGASKYKEYVPYGNDSVFLKKVIRCFSNELADRWFELRKDVLTYSNIKNEFESFFAQIPQEIYTKEQNKWSYIPAYGKWDKTQIYGSSSSFLEVRLPFVDNEMYKKYTVQPKLTVSYSTKSATRQNVIARVVPNRQDLKLDEIMYTFTKNGTHTFKAKDYKGTEVTVNATVDWIDLTAPTLEVTGNPTSWTKNDVTLTIKAGDSASGLKNVTVNGTAVTLSSGQGTYKVTKNGTYKVVATDNVGNTKEQSVTVSKIDKTAPTLEVTGNPSSWTKSDVTLTIKAGDSASGFKNVTVNGTAVTLSNGQGTYKVTKNGTYTIVVTDNVGNTKEQSVTVNKIDKTVSTLEVTGNPTSWTKNDVTLTIKAGDSASGLKSVTVNGTAVTLSSGQGTYKVTKNGTYKVIATDNVGNTKEQSVTVNKIDKTVPTLEVTGNPTSWTKSDVTLTIKAGDSASGLKSVTVNGTTVTLSSGQGTYKVTKNGTYKVIATDNVGNTKEQSVTVSKIDKTASTLEVTGNLSSWTKNDVTLTIKAGDTASGLKSVTVNGTAITLSSGQGTYKVTKNGTYKVIAIDNVGNTKEQTVTVSKIDKTVPTLEVTGNPTSWTKSDVTLTIKAGDSASGLKSVTVNGTAVTLSNGQGTYKVTKNGTYTIVATDNAGNTTEEKVVVNKIDKTGLSCEVEYSTTNPTNGNVKVTIKANKEVSAIDGWTLSKDKMKLTKTYSSNKEEQVTLKDSLGNSAVVKIKITNIDKTVPTLEVTGNPTSWTKNDVTLTIKAGDTASGLKSVTVDGTAITLSNGQGTYKVTKNETHTIVATDNAGNTKEETVTVNKIDKTVPIINKVTKTPETWTSGGVTLKVEAEDKESGIKEYSFDGGATWQTKNEKTYNKNINGIKIQVKDNAGNIKEYGETINITNIKNMTDVIEIKNYTLENNMLKGIEPETKLENLKENVIIKDATKVKILNKENKEIGKGEKITTGSKVQINAFGETVEYKIVVTGDITGDGQADYNDMMKVNLHRLNRIKLQGEYFEAGDINKDGKVDFTDFIKINLFRLKKIKTL